MGRLRIILFFLVVVITVSAQDEIKLWTLDDCILGQPHQNFSSGQLACVIIIVYLSVIFLYI